MDDPLLLGAIAGMLGSIFAGRLVLSGVDRLPPSRQRAALWALVIGGGAFAVAADVLSPGPGAQGATALIVAALPGILAYVAWRSAVASALVALVPLYFPIGALVAGRPVHAPYLWVDRLLPLVPAWMFVYGSMYVFALLPLLVVREPRLLRRVMQGWVMVLVVAYAGFLLYPTVTPRPATVAGADFASWALRLNYALDSRYNCFPCLHVAHSFVSALACYRVNRRVGIVAATWAALIAVSTLLVKQHYLVDVIAGTLMGGAAYLLFIRRFPREQVPEVDRRRAPLRALGFVGIFAIFVTGFWIAYIGGLDVGV